MFEISGGSGAGCVGNEPHDLPVETPLHPSHGALLGRSEDVLEAHGTRDGPQFRARGLLSTVRKFSRIELWGVAPAYGLPLVREGLPQ